MQQELGTIPEDNKANSYGPWEVNLLLSSVAIAAAVAFGFGGNALHWPSAIALALLPAVLIYLINREPLIYAIGKPKRDPREDFLVAFIACGFGFLMGNDGVHFVEKQMLLEYAVLVGLLCCVVTYSAARKNPQFWGAMIGMFFLATFYGWGLAAAADSLPDKSLPARYTATLIDKHEVHGRGTTYYLELEPWGPMQVPDDVRVSQDLYYSATIGHPVCIELRRGPLHVQWYRIEPCNDTGDQSTD